MFKNLKKLIRKKVRNGLKKAYLISALISLLVNTASPILLSYNYVAYAEDNVETVSEETSNQEESAPEQEEPQTEETITEEQSAPEETTSPSEPTSEETPTTETPTSPEIPETPATEEPATETEEEPETEGDVPSDTAADYKEEPATPEDIKEAKEQVSEKTCISSDAQTSTASEDAWNKNDGEKSAETKDKVELGVKYEFPFNKEVSLTFTCLPENEDDRASLSIKQLNLSDINLPDNVNAVGDYAYDLNTDMENGEFEYTLTLPKPENASATVNYIEKSEEEVTQNQIASSDVKAVSNEYTDQEFGEDSVKVTELDHFTIVFVSAPQVPVTLNGLTQVTVAPGATIDAALKVTTAGPDAEDNWQRSAYKIEGDADWTCVNTDNNNGDGTYTENFNITAPSTVGTYDVSFRAYIDNACSGTYAETSLLNGIVVVASDLVVTKTNNVSNAGVVSQPFSWTLTVTNSGTGSVTFNNQDILQDDLPNSNISYTPSSNLTVTTAGGVTGTIDCDISSNTLDCDDDSGGTSVVIPAGGSFNVTVTGTPTAAGAFANPRSGGMCKADPDNLFTESNENNNTCATNTVTVAAYSVTANPAMPQSCGLDIALILDNSTSIDSGELSDMKAAMTAFTAAFNGTPTQFSVTRFATSAAIVQAFTSSVATANTAINGIPVGGGFTNWEDGLTKGQSTLTNRVGSPDLVIFASDGNPNRIDDGTDADEATAVAQAVGVANAIKAGGARILALGIGSDLDTANLQAISGNNVNTGITSDVITSNFSTLAADLAAYAIQICGGTVTVTKKIDADGNLNTTGDQTVASGWTFNVGGQAGKVTDANGQTPAVNLTANSGYSVTETPQAGYTLASAVCTGAQNNGSANLANNQVTGIQINNSNIVSCTFINTPAKGFLKVQKTTDPAGASTQFAITATGTGTITGGGAGTVTDATDHTYEVTPGTYSVSESAAAGWTQTGNTCQNISVASGETKTCTITNTADYTPVNLCHATGSASNPYNEANASTPGVLMGHVGIGHQNGMDIIPPVPFYLPLGQNWDAAGQAIYNNGCNTTGNLKVVKIVDDQSPLTNWSFSLNGGTPIQADANGEVDFGQVATNQTHTVTESGPATHSLTNVTGANCTQEGASSAEATVDYQGTTICTFTNARDKGTITVTKVLNPSNDSGVFNLQIDGTDHAINVGDGGTTDAITLPTGSHTISEVAGTNTTLSNYISSIVCSTNDNAQSTTLDINLNKGANVTCTITNTLKNGSIAGVKYNDKNANGSKGAGEDGLNGWEIQLKNANGDVIATTTTAGSGNYSFTNIVPGTYTVCEVNQSGWTAVNPASACHTGVAVSANAETTKDFGNVRYGTIIIEKQTLPDGSQESFTFTGTVAGSTTDGGQLTTANLVAGAYSVTESAKTGWALTGLVCDDENSTENLQTRTATINIEEGETVKCTFTNTQSGSIQIIKDAQPNDAENFSFTTTGSGLSSFSLDDDNNNALPNNRLFSNLQTGTYTITEGPESNFTLTNLVCTGGASVLTDVQTRTATVNLGAAENVVCTFTNTKHAKVTGFKYNDKNGNNSRDILGSENALNGWRIFVDANANQTYEVGETTSVTSGWFFVDLGLYSLDHLAPGNYSICEVPQAGWFSSEPGNANCKPVTLTAGENELVNFGNHQALTISATKVVCEDESDLPNWGQGGSNITASTAQNWVNSHPGCSLAEGWEFQYAPEGTGNAGDTFVGAAAAPYTTFGPTNASGVATVTLNQIPGSGRIELREVLKTDYVPFSFGANGNNSDNVSAEMYCSTDVLNYDNWDFINSPSYGTTYHCVAFNALNKGSITGTKYEDVSGEEQEVEVDVQMPTVDGWLISLYNTAWELIATDATDENGSYLFEDVLAGDYYVCEEQRIGWEQKSPVQGIEHEGNICYQVTVGAGQEVTEKDFINEQIIPVLKISKTNDAVGDLHHGDNVTYTITLTLEEGDMNDVQVTDLLPKGFTFNEGSWSISSVLNPGITINAPEYHSPGHWEIGDMDEGDTITLSYTATIQNEVDPGAYKDLSWASGDGVNEVNYLALSQPEGFVNDNFVGTGAQVVEDDEVEVEIDVEENEIEEEEVLGASTELPATGANTAWLYTVIAMALAGILMTLYRYKAKKKSSAAKVTIVALMLVLAGLASPKALATSPIMVRVEDPATPQNGEFNVTFVSLDTEGRELTAKCYKKGPSDGGFVQFGSDIAVQANGDTANCVVTLGTLTEEGNYSFKVVVTADADSAEDTTDHDVYFDGTGPDKPRWIKKDKQSSCVYEVKVKTANDGETAYVEVYRDDDKQIEVGDASRIATITMGPDQEETITDNLSGDCDKPYYATRAFDGNGNVSDVRVEEIDTVTTTTTTEEDNGVVTAIVVSNSGVGADGTGGPDAGQVLGETNQTTETTSGLQGVVAGASEAAKTLASKWWFWILLILGILFGAYAIRKRKNR